MKKEKRSQILIIIGNGAFRKANSSRFFDVWKGITLTLSLKNNFVTSDEASDGAGDEAKKIILEFCYESRSKAEYRTGLIQKS